MFNVGDKVIYIPDNDPDFKISKRNLDPKKTYIITRVFNNGDYVVLKHYRRLGFPAKYFEPIPNLI